MGVAVLKDKGIDYVATNIGRHDRLARCGVLVVALGASALAPTYCEQASKSSQSL